MPRAWNKLRLFVRENGRLHPTILFWLFFIPAFTAIVAGCYLFVDRRSDQATVAASLTRTPVPATETPVPTLTPTSSPPTLEPTATEFVYDDPGDWEFVERTDPTGKTYLDLQDWQKEQVWRAFAEFWNLLYHNDGGLPDWEEVEPYVAESFVDFARGSSEFARENDKYLYLVESIEDIPHRAMVLHSAEGGPVEVKVVLVMDRSYQVQYRDPRSGEVLEDGKWLPYSSWTFIMGYRDGKWVIREEDHQLFEE